MKPIIPASIGACHGLVVGWVLFAPSKSLKVEQLWNSIQIGDSRQVVTSVLGSPDATETTKGNGSFPAGLSEESYQFFLVRYAFYFDAEGKLAGKYKYQSE